MYKKRWIFVILLVLIFITSSHQLPSRRIDTSTGYGEDGEGYENMLAVCDDRCGCDSGYYYNETTGKCMIKLSLMKAATQIYDTQDITLAHEGILSKNVRKEVKHVFKGILIGAIIIVACAAVCILSSCVYCCRINYSDYLLHKECKGLAKKVGQNKNTRKIERRPIEPIAESCPVVIEGAGVFVA